MRTPSPIRKHNSSNRWLKIVCVCFVLFVVIGIFGMARLRLLSSLRAQVSTESTYSKSQKDAVLSLAQYAASGNESDYRDYRSSIALPLAERDARTELSKSEPDFAAAKALMLQAGTNANDADDIIFAFHASKLLHLQFNVAPLWLQADEKLLALGREADRLHELQRGVDPDAAAVRASALHIAQINFDMGKIESDLLSDLEATAHHVQSVLIIVSWIVGAIFIFGGFLAARAIWASNDKLGRALQISEERLRLAMNGSNDGLWDWDIVSNQLYYSQRLLELLEHDGVGLDKDSSLFFQFIHPDDLPEVREKLKAHVRRDVVYDAEFRIITARGQHRWVRSRAQSARSPDGRAIRMAGSVTDITDRKLSDALLHAEKERAQVTLESIGDAVFTSDVNGIIEYLNPAASAITGWRAEEAKGKPIAEVCYLLEEQTRTRATQSFLQVNGKNHAPLVETNLLLVCRDGHEVAVNRSAAKILDREGNEIGNVIVLHDVSKDRAYATQLSFQANHDELTGLINRREFERRVGVLLESKNKTRQHTMLYIDLDQFKIVNDTSGHLAGDELLKQLAELLRGSLRQNDTLARLGGDEFGVLLEACPLAPALRIAELLRQVVSDFRFVWKDRIYPIGASVGLVTFGDQGATLADILRMADAACYQAKDSGRNRVQVFSIEDKEMAQRQGEMGWIGRIRLALDEDRFVLYSQKILPLDEEDSHVAHYEILLRMLDENNHVVPPIAFIPAAERYGLMPALDRWVIKKAFALYIERQAAGAGPELCAINLSGTSIGDVEFLPFVREQFLLTQVPPQHICFEITETSAIANLGKAEILIRTLRSLGCRISLDDFGSGMSSFSYLKHLPVDYLKIDGSFVKDMMIDPIDHAMVEAINRIGHVMKIATIAEFVENPETLEDLRRMGVNFAQGYTIKKPAPHLGHVETGVDA